MNLTPIGEPFNVLVKLNDDTLPSPEAVMVTGITPQSTQAEGLSEAEFAELLLRDVFTPHTITVGFNSVRFDDEFVRHLFWRTFRDPYEWSWKDGCSRWDMLDVIRMTRALRPEGIEWPVDEHGKPTNRLELITKANGIVHESAHDALSDVEALIDVTRLLRNAQPKLFEYLLATRTKKAVQSLVNLERKQPFVYTSGRYDAAHDKTTVAFPLTSAPNGNVVVYDLRHDPNQFVGLTTEQMHEKLFAPWEVRRSEEFVPLPVKIMQYNRCPAVAPVGVLEQADGWSNIHLSLEQVELNKQTLLQHPDFAEKIRSLFEDRPDFAISHDSESRLYEGFIDGSDKVRIEAVRNADAAKLADFHPEFQDQRLSDLLLRYKARNFPSSLTEREAEEWEAWRRTRLEGQLPAFVASLQKLSRTDLTDSQRFLLEELQLWAEAIMPAPDDF
ncbi:MAG: exodeoxyribonuclease [Patescibacteria group bacterium]|nr:exodeoxyribonuclease [Patescibacteria group bacterium]